MVKEGGGDGDGGAVLESGTKEKDEDGGGDGGSKDGNGQANSLDPAQVDQLLESLARSGSNSTVGLLNALKPLAALGVSAEEAAREGLGHFPVAGPAFFDDDWHAPRMTPSFHLHKGTDIFAAFDTPVRAPFDGVVTFADEAVGGKSAYVTTADGTYYYMTHLNCFAPDLANGSPVKQGQIVGCVGDSGNAKGGAPHVHFEVHPNGGEAVNPKPYLDTWLSDALKAVPALIAKYQANRPNLTTPPTPDWRMWDEMAVARQAQSFAWHRADQLAQAVLSPLTPEALNRAIGASRA